AAPEMCGIAGLFLPRDSAPAAPDMDAMLDALTHRGPDGEGRWSAPDGRYHAGFRRLAIIDLATGEQPLHDADSGRVLIGNGEIYNYRELRAAPEAAGYPFRSQGDMEAVLPLARALGEGFVQRLNGMYALALYDARQHT